MSSTQTESRHVTPFCWGSMSLTGFTNAHALIGNKSKMTIGVLRSPAAEDTE